MFFTAKNYSFDQSVSCKIFLAFQISSALLGIFQVNYHSLLQVKNVFLNLCLLTFNGIVTEW